jgi:hypothetical protein
VQPANRLSSFGAPQVRRDLLGLFKALHRQAGLPDSQFHSPRRDAANLMLVHEMRPEGVWERLAQSQARVTFDIHTHCLPNPEEVA